MTSNGWCELRATGHLSPVTFQLLLACLAVLTGCSGTARVAVAALDYHAIDPPAGAAPTCPPGTGQAHYITWDVAGHVPGLDGVSRRI